MKIVIVGTGYVGLVTGACFAEMGYHVLCLDIDSEKIEGLEKGDIPIYEPGLEELVDRNRREKRLSFTTDYKDISSSDVIFLALPTPSKEDGSCNLDFIKEAAQSISKNLKNYAVVVNKSTVPVGSASMVYEIIRKGLKERGISISFDVVSNPEFLKEGNAIRDCMKPDRIIIGTDSKKASIIMRNLYAPFMIDRDKIIEMDIPSAEMTKYAANAMLATRISFMNEIAGICKLYNANINSVRKGIGSDERIGHHFLYAGIGYGGSCFPKDLRALSHLAKMAGYEPALLNAVESVNEKQKKELAKSIKKYFEKRGGVEGKTIAIWGLSFKPNTDDMRDAPSISFIKELQKRGANLKLYDPVSMEKAKKILKNLKNIMFCKSEFEACRDADAIALLTEWKQFRLVNFKFIKSNMRNQVFFDGRNQYLPTELKKQGFDYVGIGVPDLVED